MSSATYPFPIAINDVIRWYVAPGELPEAACHFGMTLNQSERSSQ
jgi:hypothetical protein